MLAVLEIHPESSALALKLPWNARLGGAPLMTRTIDAIAACSSVDSILVVVPEEEAGFEARVRELIGSPDHRKPVTVMSAAGRDSGERERVGRARRLAPAAWRAGWAIPFALAERGDPRRLLAAAGSRKAEEILLFPAFAPFIDGALVDELVEARAESRDAILRLSTLPPGISGDIVTALYLENVVRQRLPLDGLVRFLPDRPERDLDTKGAFHWYSRERSRLRHRLTAESPRGLRVLEAVEGWRDVHGVETSFGGPWIDALATSADAGRVFAGPVPQELRLRITNRVRASSIHDTPFETTDAGAEIDPELVRRIAAELGEWREPRLVLTGGEPTLHSRFREVLEAARGAESVVLETDGRDLEGDTLELVTEHADVVVVRIDAARPATYARLHGADELGRVERNVSALLEGRYGERPAVAVELREVEENRDEIELFLDRWFTRTPWVIVSRFQSRAGQLERTPLFDYRPSDRFACTRIEETLVVHPNGAAAICDNDLRLDRPAGDAGERSIQELWTGARLVGLRALHGECRWSEEALCAGCGDWCRRG